MEIYLIFVFLFIYLSSFQNDDEISASLMSCRTYLGWAPGCDLSRSRTLCFPCRWCLHFPSFVYCVNSPGTGVSPAPADLQSLEDKEELPPGHAALNKYFSTIKTSEDLMT